ncbi:MAG: hypothetical protein FWC06_03695 [Treponema sp.]|nr:hypothetical protein [Treponema sp.]
MKKLCLLVAAMAVMALVMGCSSSPASTSAPATPQAATVTPSSTPAWFSDVPPEDVVYGIGIAKMANDAMALETATTRSQRDISRQVSAVVQGMVIDYMNQSGAANNPRVIESVDIIGRNLTNLNLTGSVVDKRDKMADGTWYVRTYTRKADILRQTESVVNNEMADYAEWRREQALAQLDHALSSANFKTQGLAD